MLVPDWMASLSKPQRLPEPKRSDAAVEHVRERPATFIEPTLAGAVVAGAQVSLIAAPAAVGKSMLARYVAAESGNPLWDLSRFNVGSHFFTGTLARVYGGRGYSEYERALASRSCTLIVDAADEALVRAGLTNYEAALHDLSELISESSGQTRQVVLLGRPETLEMTAVVLEEEGVTYEYLEVQLFEEEQARNFIATKFEATTGQRGGAPLDEYVSAVLNELQQAFPGEAVGTEAGREAESFFGYAPVLDAIARLASTSLNLKGTTESVLRNVETRTAWDLLETIVRGICEREAEKFASSFGGGEDASRDAAAVAAYSPREQARLLLAPDPSAAEVNAPSGLPWSQDLVQGVRLQLAEHPFLKLSSSSQKDSNPLLRYTNAAFRDYIVAQLLLAEDALAVEVVAAYCADPAYNPSPLLLRLFLTLATASEARPSVSALGPIVDSAGSALTAALKSELRITEGHNGALTAVIYEAGVRVGQFECDTSERRIRLIRLAADIVLDAPSYIVQFGSGLRDFSVTAPANIVARRLQIDSEEVRILGNGPVRLASAVFETSNQRLRVGDGVRLAVVAPSGPYPWHDYVVTGVGQDRTFDLLRAGKELKSVRKWFAGGSMFGPNRYPRVKMDTIWSKGRLSQDMFNYLVEVGRLTIDGQSYVFDPPASGTVIDQVDVAGSEQLRLFLLGYLDHLEAEVEADAGGAG